MDMDRAREVFLVEASEHLETAEKDVLALESGVGSADEEPIKRLFRALHTIKGGAGFLELTKVKELSHALENVADMIREGELAPGPLVTDTLLQGLDKLNQLFGNLNDENADISAEVKACDSILSAGKMPSGQSQPAENKDFHLSDYDLKGVAGAGHYLYAFTLDLIRECSGKDRTLDSLIKILNRVGKLVDSRPDLKNMKAPEADAAGQCLCSLLYASSLDDPELLAGGLDLSVDAFKTWSPAELQAEIEGSGRQVQAEEEIPAESVVPAPLVQMLSEQLPKTLAGAETSGKIVETKSGQTAEQSVRISVALLDKLMNLTSELVLIRNQNMQASASGNLEKLTSISQQLNAITSDIQTTVMQTRLCPVGQVLSKFTRIVRELSRSLGKDIDLDIQGTDVELDKSIIEAIGDPLTHLVRNAVDHGIETPGERRQIGKNARGTLQLKAFHQDGQVFIQIKDDGKGMDPAKLKRKAVEKGLITADQADSMNERDTFNLVFEAGFSTAEQVTQVSGRGVGMDVVKSVFQKLGGAIDIHSQPGQGTTISVKLPLTLAIMPALIVSVEDNCYAIPQLNIDEVVWLHGAETYQSIDSVDGKELLWLRDKPVPLLRLAEILGLEKTYQDPRSRETSSDPRAQKTDRRRMQETPETDFRNGPAERRVSDANSIYIVIVRLGAHRLGIVTDQVVDTEELVVKPFHERLKDCDIFAGTAVLGDSRIAMILDIESMARLGNVAFEKPELDVMTGSSKGDEEQAVILFDIGGKERFAMPLYLISRVQEIHTQEIQIANNREYLDYRGELIPLIRPEQAVPAFKSSYHPDCLYVIIPRSRKLVGILAANIQDTVEIVCNPDPTVIKAAGILGSQLINGKLTLFLDICALIREVEPDWQAREVAAAPLKFLLAEDTPFYQAVVCSYLKGEGVETDVAGNGREALQLLEKNTYQALISDIEMPLMDGFELISILRKDPRFAEIPALAISAMDNETIHTRARDRGFDGFQSKLVPGELLSALVSFIQTVKSGSRK